MTDDWPAMALEDDPSDVLRKAMRGNRIDAAALAQRTGLKAGAITAWLDNDGVPDDDQARALAAALHLDPKKFADAAARRWHPDAQLPPNVRRRLQNSRPNSNGYLFFLQDGAAALIDPAGDPETILRAIADGPGALRYILMTHKHADHTEAAGAVARAFPGAELVMHEADVHAIGPLAQRARLANDGDELPFGEGSIRVLHTPGHTDGSLCYLFGSTVFTGDMLFAGSVGGVFADVSTYADELQSIRSKLFTLDDATVVMPGHGPPSTIAAEKAHNPFF